MYDSDVSVASFSRKELSDYVLYLLKNDYLNEFLPFLVIASNFTDTRHLRRGWKGAEEDMLSAFNKERNLKKIRTFSTRYIVEKPFNKKMPSVVRAAIQYEPEKFVLLDRYVHILNTSNNLQELRAVCAKALALLGVSHSFFPRPDKVNFKRRKTKADISPAP